MKAQFSGICVEIFFALKENWRVGRFFEYYYTVLWRADFLRATKISFSFLTQLARLLCTWVKVTLLLYVSSISWSWNFETAAVPWYSYLTDIAAYHRVSDGRDGLQLCRVARNIMKICQKNKFFILIFSYILSCAMRTVYISVQNYYFSA